MKFLDYHLHSTFSPDSYQMPENLVKEAINKNLDEIAITDHFDPESLNISDPLHIPFDKYFEVFLDLKEKYKNDINIKIGIEFGLSNDKEFVNLLSQVLDTYSFDFVIGSIHKVDNLWIDLKPYLTPRSVYESCYEYYSYLLDTITVNKNYDVLGHLNVIERYVKSNVEFEDFKDIIEKILKVVIKDSKGIEVNTSGKKGYMNSNTLPNSQILSLYKSLGGEIITIGSDAHKEMNIRKNFDEAIKTLKEIGFKGIYSYEKRKPKLELF